MEENPGIRTREEEAGWEISLPLDEDSGMSTIFFHNQLLINTNSKYYVNLKPSRTLRGSWAWKSFFARCLSFVGNSLHDLP